MNNKEIISEKKRNNWISITGYRTLVVFIALLNDGKTIDELIQLLKNDEITSKSVSKDTIRITLNTLKSAGCQISRPSKSNNYKYRIIKHPYNWNLSKENFDSLMRLRLRLCADIDYKKIFIINSLFTKLISLTNNEEYINYAEESKPLKLIDMNILEDLTSRKVKNKKLNITYLSPAHGEENLDIIPQRVNYENSRLYLWCYSYKYNRTSILNVERIKKINTISINDNMIPENFYDVQYILTGDSIKNFEPASYEEIIDKKQNIITINAHVSNEFWFIQRLLLFGTDFTIISPDFFKEKLINKLELIKQGYEQ